MVLSEFPPAYVEAKVVGVGAMSTPVVEVTCKVVVGNKVAVEVKNVEVEVEEVVGGVGDVVGGVGVGAGVEDSVDDVVSA